jgi:hypothetical protein
MVGSLFVSSFREKGFCLKEIKNLNVSNVTRPNSNTVRADVVTFISRRY